jgi:hypothetical protein
MSEFAMALQEFVSTGTTLEVALAAIGVLALVTALVGWIARVVQRTRKSRKRRRGPFGGHDGLGGGDPWTVGAGMGMSMNNGIVFEAGSGANEFRPEPMPQFDDDDEDEGRAPGPISQIVAGGLDDIAGTGERVLEAVRERPLEFLAGALAAGFAFGVVLPLFSSKGRTVKLLERWLVENEESRAAEARREAERFRQARPK